ncbi:MAG TPA: sulfatase-like hydrolase/transferase [Acidimicrobiia bacterium]|nr:sulfatase-like hydrolase/transferase [Acidimicrobiia bacterium]
MDTEPTEPSTSAPDHSRRDLLVEFAAIVVAWNFAIAQPLLDLLGRNAEFFVARDSKQHDIWLFGVGLTLLAPIVVGLVVAAVRTLHRGAGVVLHSVVFAGLLGLFALRVLKSLFGPGPALAFVLAAAVGIGLTILFRRSSGLRTYVSYLSPVPVLFLAMFVFFSPTTKLLFPEGVASASGVTIEDPAPIVMIVFDEFAAGSLLDAEGNLDRASFPNFARLADMSTWYRNTMTVTGNTTYAVPATLDGEFPDKDKLPIPADHPNNLFTMLGGAYDIHAVQPVTDMCPTSICESTEVVPVFRSRMRTLASDVWVVYRHQVLPDALTDDLPRIDQGWGSFGVDEGDSGDDTTTDTTASGPRKFDRDVILQTLGNDRAAAFDGFLAALHRTGGPTLDFLHVLLPHAPWSYLPDGRLYTNAGAVLGLEKELWGPDEWPPITSYQRHLIQAQYVDARIGELLDTLEEAGTLDESIIVVTADHGVSFVEGEPRRRIVPGSVGGVGYVPLFIKGPDQDAGVVDDTPRQTVDIFPTLADMIGMEIPDGYDGISALDPDPPDRSTRTIFNPAVEPEPWPLDTDELLAVARRKAELFGPPDAGPLRFYGVGPHRELVGRPVAELEMSESDTYDVAIEGSELFGSVDTKGMLPSYVLGTITADGAAPDDPVDLAVAINGRIAGVTRSYTEVDGGTRWAAFLAPSLFRDGANDVAVFAIDGAPGAERLGELARIGAVISGG